MSLPVANIERSAHHYRTRTGPRLTPYYMPSPDTEDRARRLLHNYFVVFSARDAAAKGDKTARRFLSTLRGRMKR